MAGAFQGTFSTGSKPWDMKFSFNLNLNWNRVIWLIWNCDAEIVQTCGGEGAWIGRIWNLISSTNPVEHRIADLQVGVAHSAWFFREFLVLVDTIYLKGGGPSKPAASVDKAQNVHTRRYCFQSTGMKNLRPRCLALLLRCWILCQRYQAWWSPPKTGWAFS